MHGDPSPLHERASSPDSLFSEASTDLAENELSLAGAPVGEATAVTVANIPGLYIFPGLLPASSAVACVTAISDSDLFIGGARDQVMLFSRSANDFAANSYIPNYLQSLLEDIRDLIDPLIPPELKAVLWDQPLARQVILNLYPPGSGISPHVDLPHRYADGIVGVSLCGGCVMSYIPLKGDEKRVEVYLPPRSIYVLSGEARWDWAHGIPARTTDSVETGGKQTTLLRETRVSVTFRWMKDGGDELLD